MTNVFNKQNNVYHNESSTWKLLLWFCDDPTQGFTTTIPRDDMTASMVVLLIVLIIILLVLFFVLVVVVILLVPILVTIVSLFFVVFPLRKRQVPPRKHLSILGKERYISSFFCLLFLLKISLLFSLRAKSKVKNTLKMHKILIQTNSKTSK
jgi:hypothetical protein